MAWVGKRVGEEPQGLSGSLDLESGLERAVDAELSHSIWSDLDFKPNEPVGDEPKLTSP